MTDVLPIILFVLAALPLLSQFVMYPLIIAVKSFKKGKITLTDIKTELPTVDMIIAVRNGEQLIADKIANCEALTYPRERLHFIVVSDGSTDETVSIVQQTANSRFQLITSNEHIGKAKALNMAFSQSQSDILVFSDADAMLCNNAITLLVNKMLSAEAAGACGQRVIKNKVTSGQRSQQKYIDLDSWLKTQESKLGFLTSNDGKLYAVLRQAHCPIKEGVSDDLFSALNILSQKKRFVFEAGAKAYIATPSRNEQHEIERRRRITCRSLNNFRHYSRLLNPAKYGFVAFALIANKIMRRCLPLSLICIFLATMALAEQIEFLILLLLQLTFYSAAAFMFFLKPRINRLTKYGYLSLYFVLGNIGMLLGIIDFFTNKHVYKWEPNKND